VNARTLLKSTVPAIVRYSGISKALAFRYSGRGTIFLLHSVVPDTASCPEEFTRCPSSVLEDTLAWLKDMAVRFVSLDAALEILARPDTAEKFCVFSFDDGYADNLTHALPIMERFNAPFTVYVTTGMMTGEIDTRWWFGLAALIRGRNHIELPDLGSRYDCPDPASKKRTFAAIAALAEANSDARAAVETALATCGIDDRAVVRSEGLTTEQLRQLAASPLVTIGAHSDRHIRLSHAPAGDVEMEMADSRRLLENILQREIRHFAYPFGACGPREAQIAQSAGFSTAVTTERGTLFPEHLGHLHALPREPILAKETPSSLRCKIDGAYRAFYSRLGDPIAHM
jgi:peptidoglycan/xylan/chitin deacetylase (PgdA/CDA1 family)